MLKSLKKCLLKILNLTLTNSSHINTLFKSSNEIKNKTGVFCFQNCHMDLKLNEKFKIKFLIDWFLN